MLRKVFGLAAGLLVTLAVYAAGAQLRAGHPDTYTVRRGDTLWDISARFLAKPWLWPEIWQANPQVRNPHLIYPGDVLNLAFIDGGPRVRLSPRVRTEGDAVPAIPLSELRMFLKDMRVLDSSAVDEAPYVVGLEENRLRGAVGQNLYVRGLQGQPGQRWAIVRPSHEFRGYAQDDAGDAESEIVGHDLDADVGAIPAPWLEDFRNDGHYARGADLGMEVSVVGTAETLRMGDPSTLLLLDSTLGIRKGDRVLPLDETPYDPSYYPHPPRSAPSANARVIAFADALAAVGARQVVALSVGRRDGVDNGTTFSIYQPGERIADDVAGNSWRRDTSRKVTLPDEFVGHVMVFRTFDRVSYGLVMDSLKPVQKRARLAVPE